MSIVFSTTKGKNTYIHIYFSTFLLHIDIRTKRLRNSKRVPSLPCTELHEQVKVFDLRKAKNKNGYLLSKRG